MTDVPLPTDDQLRSYIEKARVWADSLLGESRGFDASWAHSLINGIERYVDHTKAQDAALAEARRVLTDVVPDERSPDGAEIVRAIVDYADCHQHCFTQKDYDRARAWQEKYGQQEKSK